MRIIRDFSACAAADKGAVIALGNFDGVHPGHQAILRRCAAIAKAEGAKAAVMTFEPHPREFFSGGALRLRLCGLRQKLRLIAAAGIDTVFLTRFNRRFASLSAEAFARDVLCRQLGARHVVTGYNFAFGKDRRGDAEYLRAEAGRPGFGFTACPPVRDAGGDTISSSAIRQCLANGDVGKAAALLGRPYAVEGRVRRGRSRGRQLGFPTANLSLGSLFTPRYGVYVARLRTSGRSGEEAWHEGVANLGVRPSFGASEPVLEAHLFDRDEDLYGRQVRVELVAFLRDEKRFETPQALQAQIAADCALARRHLGVAYA